MEQAWIEAPQQHGRASCDFGFTICHGTSSLGPTKVGPRWTAPATHRMVAGLLVSSVQAAYELTGVDIERCRDTNQIPECGVDLAPLDVADVGPVQPREFGELLLRQ